MLSIFAEFFQTSGIAAITWQQGVMILISFILLYLAIVKKFEPLLLLPIAFGMFLANLPLGGMMDKPTTMANGTPVIGGLFYYLYQGIKLGIFPPLIFMGVGAMTDFGPLIANPKSLIMGAASQLGIFTSLMLAVLVGFDPLEAASIGIIGGADGPTAIFTTTRLAPHLLGPISVAAYSYMALVPVIQPPIMRALTTPEERRIRMDQLRTVSKAEKTIFPIFVTLLVALIVPAATSLIGMLMLGNLFRESLVVEKLKDTASNTLMYIVTIFLGLTVGATASAETFINIKFFLILVLGVLAFMGGTAGGVLIAKAMNMFSKNKVNPLIGSAGVSAVPMAARVSQVEGLKADYSNHLLMHAMGPNVAGVIGSAVAAGVLLSLFK